MKRGKIVVLTSLIGMKFKNDIVIDWKLVKQEKEMLQGNNINARRMNGPHISMIM